MCKSYFTVKYRFRTIRISIYIRLMTIKHIIYPKILQVATHLDIWLCHCHNILLLSWHKYIKTITKIDSRNFQMCCNVVYVYIIYCVFFFLYGVRAHSPRHCRILHLNLVIGWGMMWGRGHCSPRPNHLKCQWRENKTYEMTRFTETQTLFWLNASISTFIELLLQVILFSIQF